MKRVSFVLLCLLSLLTFAPIGCNPGGGTGPSGEYLNQADKDILSKTAKERGESKQCRWENAKAGEAKTKKIYWQYLKDTLVCPEHNVSLAQDEKTNPDCQSLYTMLRTLDRMMKDNWCKEVIDRATALFKQGRRMVETIEGAKSCSLKNGRVRLDFFIVALCPYGLMYANKVLPELIRETGDTIDWEPHYIVDMRDGKYSSMHGPVELEENKVQMCLYKTAGKQKWMNYMQCFQQTLSQSSEKDQSTAVKKAGDRCLEIVAADATQMKTCLAKDINTYLNADMTAGRNVGVEASPTAIFNCNSRAAGAIPFEMIKPYLCELYPADKQPEACRL